MHGLDYIKAINANPAAYHAANAATDAENARTAPAREAAQAAQQQHADRVAARQKANGPYVTTQEPRHLGQDGIESAIDLRETPVLAFWRNLNKQRAAAGQGEATYGEMRKLYEGGPTPEGAICFAENGDGLRAVIAPPVNGARAYYGEYRAKGNFGNVGWVRVCNDGGHPIVYTYPDFALIAARRARNEHVPEGQR